MIGYDKISPNHQILLDLPFREGAGLITHDVAKPHHIADMTGHAPSWMNASVIGASDLGILFFNGTKNLEIPGADSLDLDFVGDFALATWVYLMDTGFAMVVMCRNTTGTCGWCMFFFNNVALGMLLVLRTNFGGPAPGRSECYAAGFTQMVWQLVGYNYDSVGQTATCFRNGQPITTVVTEPLPVPVACGAANSLLVGRQQPLDDNFYGGYMWRPRAWDRQLSDDEWALMFERERRWFS